MPALEGALRRRTIATYAIGSLGTGGFSTLPGLVLIYYMTDTLGVPPLLAGAAVAIAKVWDVVIDPVIGARSDASLAATGSRRRFMVIGAVLLPIFFVATFAVPAGLDPALAVVWVTLAFMGTSTAFSLFQVPYIALPAEIASGYDQRTRLLTVRVFVLTVAILLFGAGGPSLRRLGGDDPYLGYLIMAAVAGVVIAIGFVISSRVAPRGPVTEAPRASVLHAYRDGVAALRRSAAFRVLLLAFALQAMATGLMLAGGQYIATYVLGAESAVDVLFAALIAPALLFAPVWQAVARRVGKERGLVLASSIFLIATLVLTGALWVPGPWIFGAVALAGAGFAGMQALTMSMLPDVISHDGRGEAGTFAGVWTAGETIGTAIGATALTVVLAVAGYQETVGGEVVTQSASAIAGIVISFSVVPAALVAVSLVVFSRYGLNRELIDEAGAGA